ncbi:uncharacterized protein MICPUCDRAFT_45380 [Micromonas pusilla CCMP1545]|uniref:non-specific serine/threonine protein kinase n=1 Tax=Micromonas pusilla (strain CCMP1545) TaxID=564608 RepID=C1MM89_MICPC|nr:uncharacterized protein MICPUCDRAFT_45380 [Micromonas pusilla CCMP1545]EEH59003.1 predicted protein [Micromonas pusilla CCMP1545]|eukprot:XP_003057358.1 predicted protein [Micromonas pusilla CCMP1545]
MTPASSKASKEQVALRVLERLKETWPIIAQDPTLEAALKTHFTRLPRRYALDIHNLEDIRSHVRLLERAERTPGAVLCESRGVRLSSVFGDVSNSIGNSLNDMDVAMSSSPSASDGRTLEDQMNEGGVGGKTPLPVFEIAVSGRNRPRMLSRVSASLFDLGLNITEAHVFCTNDGYALDVFVAQGAGEWEIQEAQLSFKEKIASGAFGVLYRGGYCGQEVAIKVLKTGEKSSQEEVYREFAQELSILRKVRHRNIVQLIGAMTKPPRLCLVTDFMKGGSVLQFLHKNAPLKLPQLLKLSGGVALGMDYLHKVSVIHRDLKTANLLMDENEVVKVADFGVARVVAADGAAMTAETGTYRWMAPEVISHQHYNHKCDVFSYGILLWELISGGDIPYPGYTPLQAARGLRPTIPPSCHPVMAQVMQYCWQSDPNVRPEFEQIVELLKHTEASGAGGGGNGGGSEKQGFFGRLRSGLGTRSAKSG